MSKHADAPASRSGRPRQPARKQPAAERSPRPAEPAVPEPQVARKPAKLRPRLVRDSFTMPEADFAVIARLKSTALDARRAAKKSELLRAGLHALAVLDAQALVAALDRLEPIKTGRPKKGH